MFVKYDFICKPFYCYIIYLDEEKLLRDCKWKLKSLKTLKTCVGPCEPQQKVH